MRSLVVVISLIAFGCSPTWERIETLDIQHDQRELLLVATSTAAYVLANAKVEGGVVQGTPTQAWRVSSTPVRGDQTDQPPDELAHKLGWTRVDTPSGPVAISVADIWFVTRREKHTGESVLWGVLAAIVVGAAVFYVAYATGT
ncbi:MAG TPA: hypothetical protein VIV40_25320 [Kofleriaceae bacterium]